MEHVEEDTTFHEELVLPEKEGILASTRYVTTAAGAILKETRVSFCDCCGYRLDEKKATILCCVCRRKTCDSPQCAIDYRGRHYCEDCLQQVLPLTKLQFKIIHGLINELDIHQIKDLTRSKREEFVSTLSELQVNGYIERRGISFFACYEIFDRGILAWKTYYRSFSSDGEIAYFIEDVKNHVKERDENEAKR